MMSTMLRHSPLIEAAFLSPDRESACIHSDLDACLSPPVGVIAAIEVVQRWNLHRSGRRVGSDRHLAGAGDGS